MSGEILTFPADPIQTFVMRVYGAPSDRLYSQLRYQRARIQQWMGEMILVSYDVTREKSPSGIESRGFSLGILLGAELVFDDKEEDAFFPTGEWHVSEKNYKQEKTWLENRHVPVPRAFHDPTTDPRVAEVLIGDHIVEDWFSTSGRSMDLLGKCRRDLCRALATKGVQISVKRR